jgi:hypothetical protein
LSHVSTRSRIWRSAEFQRIHNIIDCLVVEGHEQKWIAPLSHLIGTAGHVSLLKNRREPLKESPRVRLLSIALEVVSMPFRISGNRASGPRRAGRVQVMRFSAIRIPPGALRWAPARGCVDRASRNRGTHTQSRRPCRNRHADGHVVAARPYT